MVFRAWDRQAKMQKTSDRKLLRNIEYTVSRENTDKKCFKNCPNNVQKLTKNVHNS